MNNILNYVGNNIFNIISLIAIIFTVYNTVESYSERNSKIYLQSSILYEQSMDLYFQDITNRATIDLLEVYKLQSILMEKPILTTKVFTKYSEIEFKYKEYLSELKKKIEEYNAYRFKMKLNNLNPNLDNKSSLKIKSDIQGIIEKIKKLSEELI